MGQREGSSMPRALCPRLWGAGVKNDLRFQGPQRWVGRECGAAERSGAGIPQNTRPGRRGSDGLSRFRPRGRPDDNQPCELFPQVDTRPGRPPAAQGELRPGLDSRLPRVKVDLARPVGRTRFRKPPRV